MFETDPCNVRFEVHARRGSRWLIDAMATDLGGAQEQAQELLRRADVEGVRVWKEIHDPRTQQTASRLVLAEEKPRPKRRWRVRSTTLPTTARDASTPEPGRRRLTAPRERPRDHGLALTTIGAACAALVALAAVAAGG